MTPYGSFPLFLVDGNDPIIQRGDLLLRLCTESIAATWYHAMLSGGRMQGPFGSTEAINITGTAISPLVTWVFVYSNPSKGAFTELWCLIP